MLFLLLFGCLIDIFKLWKYYSASGRYCLPVKFYYFVEFIFYGRCYLLEVGIFGSGAGAVAPYPGKKFIS